MKILVVDSLVGNDYAICLCNGLNNVGVDVGLVTTEDRADNSDAHPFPVYPVSPSKVDGTNRLSKMFRYIGYLWWLVSFARRNRYDAIHFQFFRRERLESIFFALMRFLGLNLVYTAHNVLPHESSAIDYYMKYLVYKSAHRIIVHSGYIKKKLLNSFPVDPDRVVVIPHGNFDMYLSEETYSRNVARQKLRLPVDAPVLLFFGYIREYKGLDLLLQAFEIVRRENKDIRLVVAGKPHTNELKRQYEEYISNMPERESVLFEPIFIPSEDIGYYFTAADAIALPYKHIDHSGIVHMAYSFGRPIIATDVGDFSEVIEHGQSGYVSEELTVESLAQTIKNAFSDIEKLHDMGDYAQNLSRTKYSWEDIGKQTQQLYQAV